MLHNPITSNGSALTHPCFSEIAHRFFSRLHLPVARKCNIQCNYCNRKFDCANESRPGVTSNLLTPSEAFQKVTATAVADKGLSVVGIAGPGDALANPKATFETFARIRTHFPDLHFCLSTNGLDLENHIDAIIEHNIKYVTVTLNTLKATTAMLIYKWVTIEGNRRSDRAAMELFVEKQQRGIKELVSRGVVVKVNSLLMPGINDTELVTLSKRLKLMGVSLHNIMPLIAKPEHGTEFGRQNRPTPDHEQVEEMRKLCGSVKQMAHCRQCRADAAGKLGGSNDNHSKLLDFNLLDADFGLAKREHWRKLVKTLTSRKRLGNRDNIEKISKRSECFKIAVCTKGTGLIDQEIKDTHEFFVYQLKNGKLNLLNVRKIDSDQSKSRSEAITHSLIGCSAVLSTKFGYQMFKTLEVEGIKPITDYSDLPIEDAVQSVIHDLRHLRQQSIPESNKCISGCV